MNVPLEEEAEFGKLPFDCFALERWNYDRNVEEDESQWNELIQVWLSMHPRERCPYHLMSNRSEGEDAHFPTEEQISRVLRPRQTNQERNISSGNDIIALRTCYLPELQDQYQDMLGHASEDLMQDGDARILDNETLYGSMEDNWADIYRRLPFIPDCCTMYDDSMDHGSPLAEDWNVVESHLVHERMSEGEKRVCVAGSRSAGPIVLLSDEEAIRKGMPKVLWVGMYGEVVWDNFLDPESYAGFGPGKRGEGFGLYEIIDEMANGDYGIKWERGAVLRE